MSVDPTSLRRPSVFVVAAEVGGVEGFGASSTCRRLLRERMFWLEGMMIWGEGKKLLVGIRWTKASKSRRGAIIVAIGGNKKEETGRCN